MAPLVKCFLQVFEKLSLDPKYLCKIWLLWCMLIIRELGGGDSGMDEWCLLVNQRALS